MLAKTSATSEDVSPLIQPAEQVTNIRKWKNSNNIEAGSSNLHVPILTCIAFLG